MHVTSRFPWAQVVTASVGAVLLIAGAARAQTPSNPSFETPTIAAGTFRQITEAEGPQGGWLYGTAGVGGSGLITNGSPFSNAPVPDGNQAVFLQAQSTVSQPISGWQAGIGYTVTVSAAQRPGENQTILVLLDSAVIATIVPTSSAWTDYTTSAFTTTAGVHTLKIAGQFAGDQTACIDNVRIESGVPVIPLDAMLDSRTLPPVVMRPGVQATVTFGFKNTGSQTWTNAGASAIRLGTTNPEDRSSAFYTASDWISASRPTALDEPSVPTGQVGHFTFLITAPTTLGTYGEGFRLVTEGTGYFGETANFVVTVSNGITPADPSFENPNVSLTPSGFLPGPLGSPWTFEGGAGYATNGSAFGNAAAPDGNQAGYIQSVGSISQAVTGWQSGSGYAITVAAAQRPGNNQTFQVFVDDLLVGAFTPSNSEYAEFTTSGFAVAAGTHALKFQTTVSGDQTVFIDNVRLASGVPVNPLNSQLVAVSIPSVLAPGQTATAYVEYKNTGTQTWTNAAGANPIRLGSASPEDRASPFFTASNWISASRPATLDQASVASGETGRFTFTLTAPTTLGTYGEGFRLVKEGTGYFGDTANSVITVASGITPSDPGFEHPDVSASSGGFRVHPAGSPWTFGGGPGDSGILSNGSAYGNDPAPEGVQVAFIQSSSTIAQAVGGFQAGVSYTITVAASQRSSNDQTFQALIDDQVVGAIHPSGSAFADYSTNAFTITAGSHTLTFRGTTTTDTTAFVDNVRIVATLGPAGRAANALRMASGLQDVKPSDLATYDVTGPAGAPDQRVTLLDALKLLRP